MVNLSSIGHLGTATRQVMHVACWLQLFGSFLRWLADLLLRPISGPLGFLGLFCGQGVAAVASPLKLGTRRWATWKTYEKPMKNLWFGGENMREMTVFGVFVDIWYAPLRTNPHICWWFVDDCWCFFEFEVCWRVLNCYRPALLMLSPSLFPKVSKVK